MARGLSPATKAARRRLCVWQAMQQSGSNRNASGRADGLEHDITRQAQAEDIKSVGAETRSSL